MIVPKKSPDQLTSDKIVSMAVGSDHRFTFSKVVLETNKTSVTNNSVVNKIKPSQPSPSPSPENTINKVSCYIFISLAFLIFSITLFICIAQVLGNQVKSSNRALKDMDKTNNCKAKDDETNQGVNVDVQNIFL